MIGVGLCDRHKHCITGVCFSKSPVAVAAPSGLAAHNIKGQTLHSQFKLYPQKGGRQKRYQPLLRDQVKVLRNGDLLLLIIDEVITTCATVLLCVWLCVCG